LSPSLQPDQNYDKDQSVTLTESRSVPPTQSELEIQIQAFIAGADPSFIKACEGFTRKLEDIQHDIAVLKRTIHDPNPEEMTMMTSDGHGFSSPTPTVPETGGRGWASWIRSSSGPSTPASATPAAGKHLGPSPTFGSIMTSPHRSKHAPSLNMNAGTFVNGNANGPSWMQRGGGGRGGGARDDILGRLGLRVPMPIFDSVHQPVPPLSSSSTPMEGWGWNGLSPTMPTPIKKRSVSSTMYMLGLGAAPMMTAARSRGPSNSSTTGSQNGEDSVVAVGAGVESVNEIRRGDKSANIRHETTDEETEEEDDADVE